MKRLVTALLLACAALSRGYDAEAASFNCAKANSPVEWMICDQPAISALDDRLSSAYAALTRANPSPQLVAQERAWMGRRNRCGTADCVRQSYEQRLGELDAMMRSMDLMPPSTAAGGTVAAASGSAGAASLDPDKAPPASAWPLLTVRGLPVVDLSSREGSFQSSLAQGLVNRPRLAAAGGSHAPPNQWAWLQAIYSLGLTTAPESLAKTPDSTVRMLACLMLPDAEIVRLYPTGGSGMSALADPAACGPSFENRLDASFLERDGAAAFRSRDQAALAAKSAGLPMRFIIRAGGVISKYDPVRHGFALLSDADPGGNPLRIFGTRLPLKLPDFLPMADDEAREFIARHQDQGVLPSSVQLYFGIPATIVGTTPPLPGAAPGFTSSTGLPGGVYWRFETGEVVLYEDAEMTRPLRNFGRLAPAPVAALGTAAANSPAPAGPVFLNAETTLMLLLRERALHPSDVAWPFLARARFDYEQRLRSRPDWAKVEPWGVLFPDELWPSGPSEASWVQAFQDWTERRAAALPATLTIFRDVQQPIGTGDKRDIQVLAPFPGLATIGALTSSADMDAVLKEKGNEPAQLIPAPVDNFKNTYVRFLLPRRADAYVLSLPQPVVPAPSPAAPPAVLVDVSVSGVEQIRYGYNNGQAAILVKLEPARAKLQSGDAVLASTEFPKAAWPAPVSAAPVVDPAARVAGGPYGLDMRGIRLGMAMDEAEQVIRSEMKVGRVLESKASSFQSSEPPVRGKLFIADDDNEHIAIFDAPPYAPGKVVYAWRGSFLDGDAWPQVLSGLSGKYGSPISQSAPSNARNQQAIWGELTGCKTFAFSQSLFQRDKWMENNGPVQWGPHADGDTLYDMPGLLGLNPETKDYSRCGSMVDVQYRKSFGMPAQSVFVTRLLDLSVDRWLINQAEPVPARVPVAPSIKF